MTAQELHAKILEINRFQLEQVVAGLPEDQAGAKANEHAMSASEAFVHMAECCAAFVKKAAGEEHEWGSYEGPGGGLAEAIECWRTERSAAISALEGASDAHVAEFVFFVTTHEPYHVGQLANLRLTLDSAWDPYSIYSME